MNSMLEYKGYHATIEYDAEDEIFVGEVFGIADMLCFHGTSIEELKRMFQQSIENYLELCAQVGKEPEKEFKGTFNVRITPELHKKAALAAASQKITLNQYVMKAIEKSFEEEHVNQKEIIYYIPNVIPDVTIGSINDRSSAFPFDAYKELSVVKEGLLYGL